MVILRRIASLQGLLLSAWLVAGAGTEQQPPWLSELGYRADEIYTARRGHLGMPFVEVRIGESRQQLLLDTGNMVGLTLATKVLDQLRLPEIGDWEKLDGNGRVSGTYRKVRAPTVRLLGRTLSDRTIFEIPDSDLAGLVGPDALPGTRFTLDYRVEVIAVTSSPMETVPSGFTALPMTRSSRHPRLILATGRVNGRPVLIEFDTGASRANIDPQLVRELALPAGPHGVRIDSLEIGPMSFAVPSAKVAPKSGIDPALRPPIQLSIGSDILSQVILTVDYAGGQLLVGPARKE
jgi:predicted aspartyl protease